MLETRENLDLTTNNPASRLRAAPGQKRNGRAKAAGQAQPAAGLKFPARFSTPGVSPFDQVEWETRTASITDEKGKPLFEQAHVEVPRAWSMLATNIVAAKYFYGEQGKPERERSVRQLLHRVVRTITDWGLRDGYFASPADAETFYADLLYLCLHQYGSFNSPVWFNCGLFHQYGIGRGSPAGSYYYDPATRAIARAARQYEQPQCSACFIQSVDDTMESIMGLARSEAMLFKFGSGSGTDLSTLRSTREKLSGGGVPSGPLSFLRVYDSIASVIKSGGKTRRAAKMNTLKCWHPDIKEFIQAKAQEERKAWALIEGGYDGGFNGEAYASVAFQNENLSVRLTDEFMRAVVEDREWQTHWITNPAQPGPAYRARDLMRWIAEGTWVCGDPGVQYEDTINRWHTCPAAGSINSSNPCSEFMFVDDSACNLASLNLLKFLGEDGRFDTARFQAATEIFITAQDIIVDNASYPTETIARTSHRFRPLGLGYANLGSLLMAMGLPYAGDAGRSWAATLTGLMHFNALAQSARMAALLAPFEGYAANRGPMQQVVERHAQAIAAVPPGAPDYLLVGLCAAAEQAANLGRAHGYRNAQVTLLAPTGTIGFMMDCDTTGIEPDIALVKYKALAGGGLLKIVNRTVRQGLRRLGYDSAQAEAMIRHIDAHDTIEGAPGLRPEHLPVFDCAFKPREGQRFIAYTDHIRMMAAVQPFLSGAISKTVNMPGEATVDEIMQTYIEGWKLGLKALAIYRDGCKRSQPVNVGKKDKDAAPAGAAAPTSGNGSKNRPLRRRMPGTRRSITHKFDIAGHEGYLTVGLYDDGCPGEMFITMAKEGSTIGGLMDSFGTAISMCLQYGVPIKTLVEKFAHSRFEPSGFTKNPDIPMAKSLADYIFRWMGLTFLEGGGANPVWKTVKGPMESNGNGTPPPAPAPVEVAVTPAPAAPERVDQQFAHYQSDAPVCDNCGAITVRNAACYRCYNCGNSMGCS